MKEITAYAQAILRLLSEMDVKASPENVNRITSIHAAVGKIAEIAGKQAVEPRDVPKGGDAS